MFKRLQEEDPILISYLDTIESKFKILDEFQNEEQLQS